MCVPEALLKLLSSNSKISRFSDQLKSHFLRRLCMNLAWRLSLKSFFPLPRLLSIHTVRSDYKACGRCEEDGEAKMRRTTLPGLVHALRNLYYELTIQGCSTSIVHALSSVSKARERAERASLNCQP